MKTIKNFNKKYDEFTPNRFAGTENEKTRLINTIIKYINFQGYSFDYNDINCVDIGSGNGEFSEAYKNIYPKSNFYNSDRLLTGIDFEKDKLPYEDNMFEIVFMISLVEHIIFPNLLMTEIKRILKRGGILILITPNFKYCYKTFFNDPTHYKPYTDKSIRQLFLYSGFKRVSVDPFMVNKSHFYWSFKYKFQLASYLPFTNHEFQNIKIIPKFLRGKSTSIISSGLKI